MPHKTVEPDQAKLKVIDDSAAAQGADAGYLEGYAAVFDNVDLGGEVVMKGAFAKTLKERLKKGAIKLYDSHRLFDGTRAVIGLVEDAKEDDYGLWFKARFSSTGDAQDIRTKIREEILNALSFGYEVIKDAVDEAKKVRYLKEIKLYEISVVPWGMNPKALIEAVKGATTIPPETAAALASLEEEAKHEEAEDEAMKQENERVEKERLAKEAAEKEALELAAKNSPILAAMKDYRNEIEILTLRFALASQTAKVAAVKAKR